MPPMVVRLIVWLLILDQLRCSGEEEGCQRCRVKQIECTYQRPSNTVGQSVAQSPRTDAMLTTSSASPGAASHPSTSNEMEVAAGRAEEFSDNFDHDTNMIDPRMFFCESAELDVSMFERTASQPDAGTGAIDSCCLVNGMYRASR